MAATVIFSILGACCCAAGGYYCYNQGSGAPAYGRPPANRNNNFDGVGMGDNAMTGSPPGNQRNFTQPRGSEPGYDMEVTSI